MTQTKFAAARIETSASGMRERTSLALGRPVQDALGMFALLWPMNDLPPDSSWASIRLRRMPPALCSVSSDMPVMG